MPRMLLGQILKAIGACSEAQIQEALNLQKENSALKIGKALMRLGHIDDEELVKALSQQFSLPIVKLETTQVSPEILALVPRHVVDEYSVVPVKKQGRILSVAMSDPMDLFELDQLKFIVGHDIECLLCPREELLHAINRLYGASEKQLDELIDEVDSAGITFGDEDSEEAGDDDAPIIRMVSAVITDAILRRASDIHFEPMEKRFRIRYRVDGMCYEQEAPPKRFQASVIQRLKIMAKMDIAEKRKPQDGRIKMRVEDRDIDFRVSVIPSVHGESIVMRILDKENALQDMEILGFHESDYARFQKLIKRPNGVMLVTGPTGSGKTTTLYAALKKLNKPNVKIITAEDPVEYHLNGINQCQVKHEINFTFARILRAMLRQAPNIILVGEIRDKETAEIAIQASLTGHLVFSTLHTNDAPTAITRLVDMGVKPFLVASAVQAAMAQRLIRMLCENCKEPHEPTEIEMRMVGISPVDLEGKTVYKPVGCKKCNNGYKGRKGIYEMMVMNPQLREMTFNKKPYYEIRNYARTAGMVTLLEDGVRKVLAGMTTFDEILLQTHREDLVPA